MRRPARLATGGLVGLACGVLALAPRPAAAQVPTTPAEMYTAWCARCHGTDGTGRVDDPSITVEPMDFTDCAVTTAEPDADWELVITLGGPAAGLSSQMPAYGDALSSGQVRALIGHVRTFCAESGWPLGNANFSRPIFTEKAFPEDEVVILPAVSHRDGRLDRLRLKGVVERRVGRRGHIEIGVPLASVLADGGRETGVGDVTLAGKYVLSTNRRAARILTGGLELTLPSGSEARGLGAPSAVFEPYLAAGATAGDLIVQAQLKIEVPTRDARHETEVVYNLSVSRDLAPRPSTWSIGLELNGVDDALAVTPQVRKGLTRTGAIAAAFGVRVPVVNRDRQSTTWVGYVLWEYMDPVRARP